MHYFFIGKMMAKKGGKNNIRFVIAQINRLVICSNELCAWRRQLAAGYADAVFIIIYACQPNDNLVFMAPVINGQQVISAPAANFTNFNFLPALYNLFE